MKNSSGMPSVGLWNCQCLEKAQLLAKQTLTGDVINVGLTCLNNFGRNSWKIMSFMEEL